MKVQILHGDALSKLKELPDNFVHCCITSPPYWGLRDYGVEGQLGLEPTIDEYIAKVVEIFREVRRVLRLDGTLWLNLGDTYAAARSYHVVDNKYKDVGNKIGHKVPPGLKQKDLCMIPARAALALQSDGWYLRSDIIWSKPNPMPESCTDRPTMAHEHIFLLTKSERYFFDAEAVKEECVSGPSDIRKMQESKERIGGFYKDNDDVLVKASKHSNIGRKRAVGSPNGRNCRSVWEFATEPFPGSHFAVFPKELVRRCISAGTSEKGYCPACGSPWERIIKKTNIPNPADKGSRFDLGKTGITGEGRTKPGIRFLNEATGWQPTCKCSHSESDLIPATILDPFGGSGTAGLVAAKMERCAILIELNPEYGDMSMKRIRQELGMLAQVVTL
jgi:DNA modification methylase